MSLFLSFMNHFHRTHNIDSWIKTAFVQENKSFGLYLVVEALQVRRVVTGGSHVLAHFDAGLSDVRMERRWDERYHMSVTFNQGL